MVSVAGWFGLLSARLLVVGIVAYRWRFAGVFEDAVQLGWKEWFMCRCFVVGWL